MNARAVNNQAGGQLGAVAHIPRNIIGLHAAGSKLPEKMPVLNAQEMLFGMRMHDDVLPREPEAAG